MSCIVSDVCKTVNAFKGKKKKRKKRLKEPQLGFGPAADKIFRPSLTYKDIKENIETHSMATVSISSAG